MSRRIDATIEVRRGLRADLPASGEPGEPFFCTDTGELFIWNGTIMVAVTGGGGGGSTFPLAGPGTGSVAGSPSLADFRVTDGDSDWISTFRAATAPNGEVLTISQDSNGDFFFAVYASDGTLINQIIMRGGVNGGYIRIGPDTTHGISQSRLGIPSAGRSTLSLDGDVLINITSGDGAIFGSIGGGNVVVKPANFATAQRTQLLPNADGTFLLDVLSLQIFANNAAAISGGLTAGKLYRTGGDPDAVCIAH